jgi:hypothetical protein
MRNLILSLVTILSFTEAIFAQQPGVPDLRGTGWGGHILSIADRQ